MTFEFDNDGFLTERAGELEAELRTAHAALFQRIGDINHDCHALLRSADIRNRDGEAIISATLFMRALEHYQASVLLLRRGLIAPARVALRALVETVFRMRAIAANEGAFKTFIKEDLVNRKKLINKAKTSPDPNMDAARAAITPDLVKEVEHEIQTHGAKALTTRDWSELAGMKDWYATHYALLSHAVHTQVLDLEPYLVLGENGQLKELEYAPTLQEIPELALTAGHLVLIAASAFDKVFEAGFGPKGEAHMKSVEEGFRALNEAAEAEAASAAPSRIEAAATRARE